MKTAKEKRVTTATVAEVSPGTVIEIDKMGFLSGTYIKLDCLNGETNLVRYPYWILHKIPPQTKCVIVGKAGMLA